MDTLTVANTYSQALFDAASEDGVVNQIAAEYKEITKVFEDNPQLKRLFLIPMLSALEKKEIAVKIFEGNVSRIMLNYMFVVIDKRRIGAWEAIGRQYEKLVLAADGKTQGMLYSAIPLDKKRLKALEEKTGAALGLSVRLENRIDRSLIGGVKIYVDGKLIDASVKTRLEAMKQRIIQ